MTDSTPTTDAAPANMTDPVTPTTAAPVTPAPSDPAPDTEPDTQESEDRDPRLTKVRGEAKGLRERLRASEAETSTLREQIEALQASVATLRRGEVERIATGHGMADGADLFRAGLDLDVDAMFDDDGRADPERVREVVQDVLSSHPHWERMRPIPVSNVPVRTMRGGATPASPAQRTHWVNVLKGN